MAVAAFRASFRYLLRHPWQMMLALLGVAIGVAVIVAVDLANASARKAFLLSMDAVAGEATHQVIGSPQGVDESLYTALRVEHGIRALAPVVEGDIRVNERLLRLVGVDLFAEQDFRSYTQGLVSTEADGAGLVRAFLTEPGTTVMTRLAAERLGLERGDEYAVATGTSTHTARLLAIIDDAPAGLDDVVLADIALAQEWLDMPGKLTRIDVRVEVGNDALLDTLASLLPAGNRLLNAAGRSQATVDMSAGFMTNLAAMSLLALLVGLFLILNSVGFSVLQRRSLIGTLRALGMTRAQVLALVLAEAAAIGLCAGLLGIVLGAWLGEQLLALVARSINDLYFRVTVTDVAIAPMTLLKGMVAGVGAALLGAAIPAWEATGFAPRLAMARSVLETRTRNALPWVTAAGLAMTALAVALLVVSGRNLVAGLVATFMLILGFALCTPVFVRASADWLAPRAGRLAGAIARLSVAGVSASLSRTGAAVVALAVAVSATIGVTVMVDSFRGSVSRWLDQSLQADLYARAAPGAIDEAVLAAVHSIDGVADVSTNRQVVLEDADGRIQLVAIDMAPGSYAGTELLDAEPGEIWPAWEDRDVVLVSETFAWRERLARGERLSVPTERGEHRFDIAGIYRSYDAGANSILVSRRTYERHFDDDRIDSVGVYLHGTAKPEDVAQALQGIRAGGRLLEVRSNRTLRATFMAVFDRTFVITDLLYWLAMGVAFIGILSSMLALQLERGREIATLRALGMTPAQTAGLLATQSGLLGLLAGIAAIPLGIAMAWVLIVVINRRAFGWEIAVSIDTGIVAASVGVAVLAALLAGLYPALRAASLRPAAAMREE